MTIQRSESITIPGASAGRFQIATGQCFRIVDVEGHQVVDFVALSQDDPYEFSSPSETILFNYPQVRLSTGHEFYSSEGRPMFVIEADDSDGAHDFLYAACNKGFFEHLGHPNHPSCRENLALQLTELGVNIRPLPAPINLFQDTYPQADGTVTQRPAPTRPGDGITIRALMDATVLLSSCAYDVDDPDTSINGDGPSPIRVDFLGPSDASD